METKSRKDGKMNTQSLPNLRKVKLPSKLLPYILRQCLLDRELPCIQSIKQPLKNKIKIIKKKPKM